MNSINRFPLKEIVPLIKSTDTNAEDHDQSNRQDMSLSTSEENVKPSKLMLRKTYKRKMDQFDSSTHRKMEVTDESIDSEDEVSVFQNDSTTHINPNDDVNSSSNAGGPTEHLVDTSQGTVNSSPFQCEKCNVYFPTKASLDNHRNKKTPCVKVGVFKYVCAKCSYKTNHPNAYQRHVNRKTDCSGSEKILQCQQCNQVFNRQSKLDIHIAKCIGIPGMKKCKDCGIIQPKHDFQNGKGRCNKCIYEIRKCVHGKAPGFCPEKECWTNGLVPRNFCKICCETQLGGRTYKTQICAGCEKSAGISPPERVEIQMKLLLEELVGIQATMADKTPAVGVNCAHLAKKRPDIVFRVEDYLVIVVEVDEDCHAYYPVECELAKVSIQNEAIQLSEGVANVPIITLRVNPDKYHGGDVPLEERARLVASRMKELGKEYQKKKNEPSNGYMRVEYFYYDERYYDRIEETKKYFPVMVFP